jgi:hypothetical protein
MKPSRSHTPVTSLRSILLVALAVGAAIALPAASASAQFASLPPLPSDNLVRNASFEGSTSGWSSWQGRLSLVSGGAYGSHSVKVTASSGVSSYTLDDWPDSVSSTTAGVVYEATAAVRGIAGRRVCIIIREWSSSTFVASSQACVTASASWQHLGPATYSVRRNGGKLDVYLAQSGALAGDSFEVDGVVLRRQTAEAVVMPPTNTTLPTISGTAQVGQTLVPTHGTWAGSPTSFAYQWLRCNAAGVSCAAISGASLATYTLVTADEGATIRLAVTASNSGGSATATSLQTPAVEPVPPAPAPSSSPTELESPSGAVAAPPAPPRTYAVPANAVVVRTASELATAVASSTPRDIVLEDGVYTRTSALGISVGHRLWARTLGGATLRFGLILGGNFGTGGQELRGLRIDVTDPALAFQGAAVNTWGAAGQHVGIYDSWILGNRALSAGVRAHQTNGLKVQRVVVRGFIDWGVFFQAYYPAYLTDNPAVKPLITDADISSVHRPVRGASDGRAEAGLWAGVGCTCARIKIRDTGWSGVETAGNVNNGVFEDLDIGDVHGTVPAGGPGLAGTRTGVGIYVEHYTRSTVFRRVHVHAGGGVKPRVGANTEWADPGYVGTNPMDSFVGAAFDVVFEDSTFDTTHDGLFLTDATRTTVRRVTFVGQKYAGIRDFMTSGTGHSTTRGDNTLRMQSGAVAYTTVHGNNVSGYNS